MKRKTFFGYPKIDKTIVITFELNVEDSTRCKKFIYLFGFYFGLQAVNFINVLRAQFLNEKLVPKIQSQKVNRKKAAQRLFYVKGARKMLV